MFAHTRYHRWYRWRNGRSWWLSSATSTRTIPARLFVSAAVPAELPIHIHIHGKQHRHRTLHLPDAGQPECKPGGPALPFVLYASGANRGFLLDQSSTSVMTGTMNPQRKKPSASSAPSEIPGTYAAATMSNGSSTLCPYSRICYSHRPETQSTTSQEHGSPITKSNRNEYPDLPGTGTIALSAGAPATSVIYAIDFDSTNSVITDFMMIGTTSGTSSSIIFAQQ